MFSGRRSARSETGVAVETGAAVDGGLAAGAPFPASASVKTGLEVSSGKIGKPRVSNLRQCCRFFQRKVRIRGQRSAAIDATVATDENLVAAIAVGWIEQSLARC